MKAAEGLIEIRMQFKFFDKTRIFYFEKSGNYFGFKRLQDIKTFEEFLK